MMDKSLSVKGLPQFLFRAWPDTGVSTSIENKLKLVEGK